MILIHPKAGLGNQMFIYALGRAISLEYKEKLCLDLEWFRETDEREYGLCHLSLPETTLFIDNHPLIKLGKKIKLKLLRNHMPKNNDPAALLQRKNAFTRKCGVFSVTTRSYDPVLKKPLSPLKIYYGPFQSAKYFDKYRHIICSDLKVSTPVSKEHSALIDQMKSVQSVCLHIRRGDYLTSPEHNVCQADYFLRAVQKIQELIPSPVFFVFSDDIDWCRTTFKENNFIFCSEPSNTDYEELRLMYNCKHFIIPNSTFSWWAQYMGDYEEKIVIAPDRWYNGISKDIKDIYMPEWEVISAS